MKQRLRILLLEHVRPDAATIQSELRKSDLSFQIKRVDTRDAYWNELGNSPPDLILSAYSVPGIDGMTALGLARGRCSEVPFIFVTATLGEERAIESLKKGATDYVLKQRISRLAPAVHRALREARDRSLRKLAERRLRESCEQLHSLSAHLQSVREDERTRIAHEVHDELGHALTGLKAQLTSLASHLPKTSRMLHDRAASLSISVDATIQSVQRIATALRPEVLDEAGLLPALEWQAREFRAQTGIECRIRSAIHGVTWGQELNTAFFRIFQEALTNVIRHSRATRVLVLVHNDDNDLVLEIKDNGIGIAESEIHNTRSIGLLGMQERAGLLGGEVQWHAEPGKGTAVTVRIPRWARMAQKSLVE